MKPTTPFSVCKEFCAGSGGTNGTTFIPNVSPEGVISWTNDGGLKNPDPVIIKGKDGYTPQKGKDYFTDEEIEEIKNDGPITVLEYYPSESDIDNMTYGCYIYNDKQPYKPYIMVLAGIYSEEIKPTPDGDYTKIWTYRQTIIDRNGVKVREKAISDNYADWSYDWQEVPLNKFEIQESEWHNIDLLYGRENDGVYKVSGKTISGIVGMGNSTGYLMVTTNVNGNELQTCQHYIDSTGKIQYRIGKGTDLEDWSEWTDVGGGVSKEYVDNAIGDIETSLENIIAKYGLGGDSV